jgi:hypothetical protein
MNRQRVAPILAADVIEVQPGRFNAKQNTSRS